MDCLLVEYHCQTLAAFTLRQLEQSRGLGAMLSYLICSKRLASRLNSRKHFHLLFLWGNLKKNFSETLHLLAFKKREHWTQETPTVEMFLVRKKRVPNNAVSGRNVVFSDNVSISHC